MAGEIKVLLVDDNPMVLAMLRTALSPLATVRTAVGGEPALAMAAEDAPDLVVTDYQMAGTDGRQLIKALKSKSASAHIPIILLASKSHIHEKLKMLQDDVEDFIEKPFFVKEATARIKRVLDKIALEKMAREAPGESTLRGTLAQMNVIDLLQSLELGRKTCLLSFTSNGDRCEMYFNEGQINHATYGAVVGDEAVFKVLTWQTGNFQIDFTGGSAEQSISRSTQGLLMEGLRLLDEAGRDAEQDNVLDA
ncbi:MAG TPA: DUF4388 domain-containing protein [Clostridia bacterium]|nr:DUF4388 domain-containing protein [Clostridia bacterium]